jgi:hypothetical protein
VSSRRPRAVVQRVRVRKLRGIDGQLRGELVGHPVIKQARAGFRFHGEQLRTDDRDDSPLLDEIEQVVPGVLVEARRLHLQAVHAAHGQAVRGDGEQMRSIDTERSSLMDPRRS